MSVVTIFSGIFCNETTVIKQVQDSTGLTHITDAQIVSFASELSGIHSDKLNQAFLSKTSIFNNFTHEKECSIAYLRLALANIIENDNMILSGYSSLLLPQTIHHALKICLVAKKDYRIDVGLKEENNSTQDAIQSIDLDDQNKTAWTQLLFSDKDPWDSSLYDIMIPIDKTGIPKASALIEENMLKSVVMPTATSKIAVEDFLLSSQVEVALVNAGHNVGVQAKKGAVTLSINHQVLMLKRLEDELKSIAQAVSGVKSIEIIVAQSTHNGLVYRKHNTKVPSKVLLVDDEIEFVQTLSERLQMREMGSVVAYDGQSALDLVHNDDPEVMIIDLKMPGIDGMEILKKVKQTRPKIEVIVLTGHGSEQDRIECMELGAFAYMQKPVDINILSESLNQAHNKIKANNETI